jgi:serine/threonine protein kinase
LIHSDQVCARGKIVKRIMAVAPGTRLGPYEILASLGAGGMGEVYRVRHTRLERTVAIKILPSHLDNDSARQRFQREARAISALNHPNICTLYDVGQQDGIDYLVMEYLEGDRLDERLQKGSLTPDEALRLAVEIGVALEQAHRRGVIHRDLKPGQHYDHGSGFPESSRLWPGQTDGGHAG